MRKKSIFPVKKAISKQFFTCLVKTFTPFVKTFTRLVKKSALRILPVYTGVK